MEPTIEQLKAMAYDRIQMVERIRQELDAINRQIVRLQQEGKEVKHLNSPTDKNMEKKNAPTRKIREDTPSHDREIRG